MAKLQNEYEKKRKDQNHGMPNFNFATVKIQFLKTAGICYLKCTSCFKILDSEYSRKPTSFNEFFKNETTTCLKILKMHVTVLFCCYNRR